MATEWTFDSDEDGWSMDNAAFWTVDEGEPNVGCIELGPTPGDNGAISYSGTSDQENIFTYYYKTPNTAYFTSKVLYDDDTFDEDIDVTGTSSWQQYEMSINAAKTAVAVSITVQGNGQAFVDTISLGVVAAGSSNARFYFGSGISEGSLVEQFTLPFAGVAPKAMTLKQSLGTVVMGSNAPAGVMAVYSDYPYPTGTATDTQLPTGAAITAMRWI